MSKERQITYNGGFGTEKGKLMNSIQGTKPLPRSSTVIDLNAALFTKGFRINPETKELIQIPKPLEHYKANTIPLQKADDPFTESESEDKTPKIKQENIES